MIQKSQAKKTTAKLFCDKSRQPHPLNKHAQTIRYKIYIYHPTIFPTSLTPQS